MGYIKGSNTHDPSQNNWWIWLINTIKVDIIKFIHWCSKAIFNWFANTKGSK